MTGFRKYGRKILRRNVTLVHSDLGEIAGETKDISDGGVFVKCPNATQAITIGDEFIVNYLRDAFRKTNRAHLRVVRLTDEGVGMAFD